jgi:hypothetical protein
LGRGKQWLFSRTVSKKSQSYFEAVNETVLPQNKASIKKARQKMVGTASAMIKMLFGIGSKAKFSWHGLCYDKDAL